MLRLFRGRVAGDDEREPASRGSLLLWQPAVALLADGNRQAIVRQIREEVGVPAKHFEQLYQGLIERFAELVQLLPASENHHHAHTGGLLDHSLDVAQKAVAIRRGHLLPPGAEPEEVARASDRWTYAVFSAGLLHDVGKAVLLGDIEQFSGGKSLGSWIGWSGPMRGTERYRFRFAAGRRYEDYPLVGPFLARALVPEVAITWLGSDRALMSLWIAALAGDEQRGGAVSEIVAQADRLSVAASLGVEAAALPAAARKSPLHVRLTWALRELIDSRELPINRRGAGGWVFEDELFVVAKRAIDAMRERLIAEGHADIPSRNDRIMDELQQHRVCVANGDRAIWTVRITLSDFDQTLTVLRFPLAAIWPTEDGRPPAMNGTVTVEGEAAPETQASASAVSEEVEVAGIATGAPSEPAARANVDQVGVPPRGDPVQTATERQRTSLDATPIPTAGGEEMTMSGVLSAEGSKAVVSAAGMLSAPTLERELEGDLVSEREGAVDDAKPDEPEAFIAWLRAGVNSGRLQLNQVNSLLHVVPEGLLLVSPKVFKVYAGDADGRNWEYVQRRFVRRRWHRVHAAGKNIFEYEVKGDRKSSRLKGIVVSEAGVRLGISLPEANPHLSRMSAL